MTASRACLPKMRYALARTDARSLHALSFQHAKFATSALRRARMDLRIERSRGTRQVGGVVPRERRRPCNKLKHTSTLAGVHLCGRILCDFVAT